MKARILIWILAVLCFTGAVQGVITDGIIARYDFTTNASNQQTPGTFDWTVDGYTRNDNCYKTSGCYGGGAGSGMLKDANFDALESSGYTLMFWISVNHDGSNDYVMDLFHDNGIEVQYSGAGADTLIWYHEKTAHGDWDTGTSSAAFTDKNFRQVILWWNTTHKIMYVNGTASSTEASAGLFNDNQADAFGGTSLYAKSLNGNFSDTVLWNRSLSSAELSSIFNKTYSEFAGGGTSPTTDLYITAKDEWNSTAISTFYVNISWTNGSTTTHNTATGSIYLTNVSDATTTYNITFWNVTDYFPRTYLSQTLTNATNNTIQGSLHQAELCLNASAKASGSSVILNNVTIGSTVRTSSPFCYNLSVGTYNALAQKTGWYSKNQSFTATALMNSTLTFENMTYANLTISAKDGTTNASLSNCNTYLNSINWTSWPGESQTGTLNDSYYLVNGTYNVTIICTDYALTDNVANITVSGHTNYTFTLWKSNSVRITILDEITLAPIMSNVTVRWTSNATTWENVTSTSQLFVYNLTPATYTLLFYSSNYSTRTYTITVGNATSQTLIAYMISSTYSTIFTIKDIDTFAILDNTSITMYKQNGTGWVTVESKYSDISGKSQFYYDPIGSYKFQLDKEGYEQYVFFLNPILFSTYDVYMTKTSLLNYSVDFDKVSIIYAPTQFWNGENVTFNWLISSPDGLLTAYGINLTYPGGNCSTSGSNAIGSQLSCHVNITGATVYNTVRLIYNYTTTTSGFREYTVYLPIIVNGTAGATWMSNKSQTYGLGIFERLLIATIIIIFTVGIATLVGQALPGIALGLFVFGFLCYIGFVPLWSILPSMLIGVFFLVWKSGGY